MFSTEVQGEMDIDAAGRAELGPAVVSQSGRAVALQAPAVTLRERERGRATSGLHPDLPPPPPSSSMCSTDYRNNQYWS